LWTLWTRPTQKTDLPRHYKLAKHFFHGTIIRNAKQSPQLFEARRIIVHCVNTVPMEGRRTLKRTAIARPAAAHFHLLPAFQLPYSI
jgi:hypothetical protein